MRAHLHWLRRCCVAGVAWAVAAGVCACVPVPGPARPEVAPEEAPGFFSPGDHPKAILLDLSARGVPGDVADRVGRLVTVALASAGYEVRHESDLDAFWDASRRRRLLGRGRPADLARLARRFGADQVLGGWVGRSGKARALDLWAVGISGRVVGRAAAVWRGDLPGFYVAVRQAAERMRPPPPGTGPVDAAALRFALRGKHGFFESCLARGVMADPALAGEATVDLTVGPGGGVQAAVLRDSTLMNQAVEDCLKAAAGALRFPAGAAAPVTVSEEVSLPANAPQGDTSLPNP